MDTKLKKFNLMTFKKLVALILCLVCVAGCFYQLTNDILFKNINLNDFCVKDAITYAGKKIDSSNIHQTETFELHAKSYAENLCELIDSFSDGSQQAYELYESRIETKNKAIREKTRQRLVEKIIYDDFQFTMEMVACGVIERLVLIDSMDSYGNCSIDLCDESSDPENYFYDLIPDNYYQYDSGLADIPENILANENAVNADGVFKLSYDYNVISYNESYDVVDEYYPSGYYAFKINDKAFENMLQRVNPFDKSRFDNYSDFKDSYNSRLAYINESYASGRYFFKNSSGKVYTNIESLTEKSTDKQIEAEFEKLGFYCRDNGHGDFTLKDGRMYFAVEYNYYDDFTDVTMPYDGTTVLTTIMHEASQPTTKFQNNSVASISVTEAFESDGTTVVTTNVESAPEPTTAKGTTSDGFLARNNDEYIGFIGVDLFAKNESGKDLFQSVTSQIEDTRSFLKRAAMIYGIGAIVFIACLIYLIVKSGRRGKSDDELHLLKTDLMFTEWRIILDGLLISIIGTLAIWVADNFNYESKSLLTITVSVCATLIAGILIDALLFITKHIKNRTLLKRSFIGWALIKFLKLYRGKIKPFMKERLLYSKELKKGTVIKMALAVAVNFLLVLLGIELRNLISLLLVAVYNGVIFVWALRYLGGLDKIFSVIKSIKSGKYDVRMNLNALPENLREGATEVINIGDGFKNAIDEAVKQEQTKTELITNVSHDLKTPLTSIINYVELLKKCNISDENAEEYLNILGEKSDRLKKLIEDLVEASKASTGNINVDFVGVSLNEMVNQLLGEHSDVLEAKKLKLITDIPESDVIVRADSKLLYRVMENLIVNVEKYSLYGTRVYVTVKKEGEHGTVTFKNISEQQLNISAEQLKERFVRGDESRSSEGNGLGLSIAQSLCEIQNGALEIIINGDLFTAKVKFAQQTDNGMTGEENMFYYQ